MTPIFYFIDEGHTLYCQLKANGESISISMNNGFFGMDHLGIRPENCNIVFDGALLSSWAGEVYK